MSDDRLPRALARLDEPRCSLAEAERILRDVLTPPHVKPPTPDPDDDPLTLGEPDDKLARVLKRMRAAARLIGHNYYVHVADVTAILTEEMTPPHVKPPASDPQDNVVHLKHDEAFEPALYDYLSKYDWQPIMIERIEGFSAGWIAHRTAPSADDDPLTLGEPDEIRKPESNAGRLSNNEGYRSTNGTPPVDATTVQADPTDDYPKASATRRVVGRIATVSAVDDEREREADERERRMDYLSIRQRNVVACDALRRLCNGEQFHMSIPVDLRRDHDVQIGVALRDGLQTLNLLDAARAERDTLRDDRDDWRERAQSFEGSFNAATHEIARLRETARKLRDAGHNVVDEDTDVAWHDFNTLLDSPEVAALDETPEPTDE